MTDLATGEREFLFEHDPQDNVMVGAVSRDGERMAFGTRGERVFSYDARTGEQVTLKPKNIWDRVGFPMYTLEAPPTLDFLITASAEVGAEALYEKRESTRRHDEERYLEVRHHDGSYRLEPMHRGINLWTWGDDWPEMIDDDFSDKIRADWSRDGRLVAIGQQQGGNSYFHVYEIGEDGKVR